MLLVMLFPPCCILTLCYVSVFFPTLSSHGMIVCVCVRAMHMRVLGVALVHVSFNLCTCAPVNQGRGNHYAYYAYRHHEGKETRKKPSTTHDSVSVTLTDGTWGSDLLTFRPRYRPHPNTKCFLLEFYIHFLVWLPNRLLSIPVFHSYLHTAPLN